MELNAVEVFKIARQLEEEGMEFYQKAAAAASNPHLKAIFSELSQMEAVHYKIFSRMEKEATPSNFSDADEIMAYVGRIFGIDFFREKAADKIGSSLKNDIDIFQFALKSEELAIDYYSQIQATLSSNEDIASLGKIIDEERGHKELMERKIKEAK